MPDTPQSRHYVSRGMDVRITAEKEEIELRLNGMPVDVIYLDGEYHSQMANQFTGFPTIDALVESLLQTQGRTWSGRGGSCCGGHPHGEGGHPHDGGGHPHDGGGHPHNGGGHPHNGGGHPHNGGGHDHGHGGGGHQ
ncbi:hypothetical protein OG280_00505 [Streptomyces virginiae]|uniref:hypothetical protein n=1 Tax=Streptomyces virginiae TaxID=1961 RepID=UPI002DDB230F|nr:hypothetical protein [Streptomyces virginiae]WSC82066.1 hypothetical protein OHA56_40290 [Streptomyces virginiae]